MSCNDHNAQGTPISECGFDEATQQLIYLCRFYFTSYAAGETPDCETAVDICRKGFGQDYAVEISIGLLCVLSAMRERRKTIFRYNSATCLKCHDRVSDCERLLFMTIQSIKDGRYSQAHVSAMMLCEGHDTTRLFREITRLNSFLEKAQSGMKKIS
ncbi:MAG: hypothetical protein AAGA76_10730 [Pseudomonadota bacterium]